MESTTNFTYSSKKELEIEDALREYVLTILLYCPSLLDIKFEERIIKDFINESGVVSEDTYTPHKNSPADVRSFICFLLTSVLKHFLLAKENFPLFQEKPAAQLPENLLRSHDVQHKVDRIPDSDDESLDIEMDTSLEHQSSSRVVSQQLSPPQHNTTGKKLTMSQKKNAQRKRRKEEKKARKVATKGQEATQKDDSMGSDTEDFVV